MRFRNAAHITIDNFQSVFKLLLYRIIIAVLSFSLVYLILKLSLSVLTDSAELQTLRSLVGEFFRSIVTGDSERLHVFQDDFQAALKDFLNLLGNHIGSIAGAIVGVVIIYLLSRFANGLAVFAVGVTVNDRMSIYSRTSFSQAFFKQIGQASLYQVLYVPLSFVFDALAILVSWFLFFYAPSFLPARGFLDVLITLSLTLTAIVCLESLKMTLISAWMPAMIADGKPVLTAFRESVCMKKDFGRRFVGFLCAIYLIIVVNVVFGIFTLGSALLLTVPMSFIFVLAMQFVNYYKTSGRKFFISYRKIEGEDDKPETLPE